MTDPFSDPLGDLDALEQSIERSSEPPTPLFGPDCLYMDATGLTLGALERRIEATAVPPPPIYEPALQPPTAARATRGFGSDETPTLREPERLPWVALEAPPAARPSITRDGIGPPARQSRGGGGAGRYSPGLSPSMRLCPGTDEFIAEEECGSCDQFGDWSEDGSGPECYYDWVEQQEGEDE